MITGGDRGDQGCIIHLYLVCCRKHRFGSSIVNDKADRTFCPVRLFVVIRFSGPRPCGRYSVSSTATGRSTQVRSRSEVIFPSSRVMPMPGPFGTVTIPFTGTTGSVKKN